MSQTSTSFLYAFVLLLICNACQPEVSTENTMQRYEEFFVRYIADQGQVKATAMFFEQDSIQKASPIVMPDGVKFQNRSMELKPLPGGAERFLIEQQSDYPKSFIFEFTDVNQQPGKFEISMPTVKNISVKGGICSLDDGLYILMDPPLSARESAVVFLTDEAKKASTFKVAGPSKDGGIHISSDEIARLTPGTYEMYLIKSVEEAQKAQNCTTTGVIEYYSSVISFDVVE